MSLQPDVRDAINLGALLRSSNRLNDAAAHYRHWISIWPDNESLNLNAANCLRELGEPKEALALISEKLANPEQSSIEILESAGKSFLALGQLRECQNVLQRILEQDPNHFEALVDTGVSLSRQEKLKLALNYFNRAQKVDPQNLRVKGNRITILCDLGEIKLAKQLLQEIPASRQNRLDIKSAKSGLLMAEKEMFQALEILEELTFEEPHNEAHWLNRAASLRSLKRLVEAHLILKAGIKRHPLNFKLRQAYGQSLAELGKPQLAIPLLREVMDSGGVIKQELLFNLQFLGASYNLISSTERKHLAQSWEEKMIKIGPMWPDLMIEPRTDRRLRIGYISADFSNHPVGRFTLPIIQNHNKETIEVWCFSCTVKEDSLSRKIKDSCEHWIDLRERPSAIAARIIADQRLDILIELGGFTGESPIRILIERPAPIQLSYLGYPAPTYLKSIDGWLGDKQLFKNLNEIDMNENLIRLPGGYMAYEPQLTLSIDDSDHKEFHFGSFNHARKLTPQTIDLWVKLLNQTPNAKLVLKSISFLELSDRERIKQIFTSKGLNNKRLKILPWVEENTSHLTLYKEIDVALDPIPYGGATTTAEALWMGVPVITIAGKGMVGGLSASILHYSGCNEWIANNEDQFITLGKEFANLGPRPKHLRQKLREKIRLSEFGNAKRLANELENTYQSLVNNFNSI